MHKKRLGIVSRRIALEAEFLFSAVRREVSAPGALNNSPLGRKSCNI